MYGQNWYEYFWDDVNDETVEEKLENAIVVGDSSDENGTMPIPEYGFLRQISQKSQQLFLEYNSLFAICMIVLTSVKLFVQIFDVITDIMVAGTIREDVYGVYYVISIVFMTGPLVTKWKSTGKFITQKCKQGINFHIY